MASARTGLLAVWIAASAAACATAQLAPLPEAARTRDAPALKSTRFLGPRAEPPPKLHEDEPPDLYVGCEQPNRCPEAVGMLVVDRTRSAMPERCTATLVAPDRILTASHCIAPSDRRSGASCTRTWIAFPASDRFAGEWVACKRVVFAASIVSEDALHQEHAVLQLARSVSRTPLRVDPAPPEPNSIVTVASVTPHPVYGSTHTLSVRLCRAIDSQPAEAALGAAAANVGWLASCPMAPGNSGSPVLDYAGHIRAIVHGGTSLTSAFGVTSAPAD